MVRVQRASISRTPASRATRLIAMIEAPASCSQCRDDDVLRETRRAIKADTANVAIPTRAVAKSAFRNAGCCEGLELIGAISRRVSNTPTILIAMRQPNAIRIQFSDASSFWPWARSDNHVAAEKAAIAMIAVAKSALRKGRCNPASNQNDTLNRPPRPRMSAPQASQRSTVPELASEDSVEALAVMRRATHNRATPSTNHATVIQWP